MNIAMNQIILTLLFFLTAGAYAEDTQLKLYRPYGEAEGQIVPRATITLQGQCSEQSQLIVREDAWRCIADQKIYDPCFSQENPTLHTLICPSTPWTEDSVQIEVTGPLNEEQRVSLDMSRTFPWAIELHNGARCIAVTPGQLYDSMSVRYQCSGDNQLLGYVQRCKPEWTMLEKTAEGVRTVSLKKVWF